ncbi:MAG: response regulator transcription factor [Phaeodactylibacter sp.]|nr:response regulator transcription factor [Phaeodactylibacter sp.]
MKRAILIDDEAVVRDSLRNLLQDYCPEVYIVGEADGVATGLELLSQTAAGIVFLDVQMQDGTGFDLLDQYPGNYPFHLIFITAYDEFAVRAFEYNALDYLTKPIAPQRLMRAVARTGQPPFPSQPHYDELLRSVKLRRFDKIALSTNDGIRFLPLDQLLRLEASGSYTTFYTADGQKEMVARILKDYEIILSEESFFRSHQSHIINLDFIEGISTEEGLFACMQGGARIPIARRRKEQLMELLKQRSLF